MGPLAHLTTSGGIPSRPGVLLVGRRLIALLSSSRDGISTSSSMVGRLLVASIVESEMVLSLELRAE